MQRRGKMTGVLTGVEAKRRENKATHQHSKTVVWPNDHEMIERPCNGKTVVWPNDHEMIEQPCNGKTVVRPNEHEMIEQPCNGKTVVWPKNHEIMERPCNGKTVVWPNDHEMMERPCNGKTVVWPNDHEMMERPCNERSATWATPAVASKLRTVRKERACSSSLSSLMRLNVGCTLLHMPHQEEYSSTTAWRLCTVMST